MRALRWLGFVASVAMVLMMMPAEATADGGAYIDLDRTHFLVGSTGHAETYLSVPADKQGLFERGPFYLFATAGRSVVTEGRPLPGTAVRLATMTIEHDRGTAFELSAAFTVPDLPGGYYALGVCNDPCTISGFREPLTGEISIVQTPREAELLNERQHLSGQVYGLKRDVRKLRRANDDVSNRLEASGLREAELSAEVERLRNGVADARRRARSNGSFPWLPIALWVATIFIAAGTVVVRRRRPAKDDDVPVMVHVYDEVEPPRERSFR